MAKPKRKQSPKPEQFAAPLQRVLRTPASPNQVQTVASQIATVLLDYSDDEQCRIMVAASAIMGDSNAVSYYAERIESNAMADAVDAFLPGDKSDEECRHG